MTRPFFYVKRGLRPVGGSRAPVPNPKFWWPLGFTVQVRQTLDFPRDPDWLGKDRRAESVLNVLTQLTSLCLPKQTSKPKTGKPTQKAVSAKPHPVA